MELTNPSTPKDLTELARNLRLIGDPNLAVSQLRSFPKDRLTPFQAKVLGATGVGLARSIVDMLSVVRETGQVAGWLRKRLAAAVARPMGRDWKPLVNDFRLTTWAGASLAMSVFDALTTQNEGGARVALWLLEHPESTSLSGCCRAVLEAANSGRPSRRRWLLEEAREAMLRATSDPMAQTLLSDQGLTDQEAIEMLVDQTVPAAA